MSEALLFKEYVPISWAFVKDSPVFPYYDTEVGRYSRDAIKSMILKVRIAVSLN
jgi:hypothetical protein